MKKETRNTLAEDMKNLAARYQLENELLDNIASGNKEAAMQSFHKFRTLMLSPSQSLPNRTSDPVRNLKNSMLSANTLYRKAVERNHVPPYYIDIYSAQFATQIEACTSTEELGRLYPEMIHKYCHLARNYSLANYSATVRNAIMDIHVHLYAPLSLKQIAERLSVSSSYLSAQFKTEVGMTVTEYIRTKRMEEALKLLHTTDESIEEISFLVGIEDPSYFSKQFKQHTGMSPQQYQKMVRQGNHTSF